jgi:hypothetical protein
LTLANVQSAQAGNYSVAVSNLVGGASSAPAHLTVLAPPAITSQPLSQTVRAGADVTFQVAASGSAPLSYRWLHNGTNLADGNLPDGASVSGAASATLHLTGVLEAQAGAYSVVASNAAGAALSSNALLTVILVPAFTSQPQSQSVALGGTASFTVTAVGSAPLSYQWRHNGTPLADGSGVSGTATPTLTLSGVQSAQAGAYSVTVSNDLGGVISAAAQLTVVIPPAITSHPQSQSVRAGTNIMFEVAVSGSSPLSYQWLCHGSNLVNGPQVGGATTTRLTLTNVQDLHAGSYSVVVSNAAGSATSSNALLTVTTPAGITTPPASQSVDAGGSVTFLVVAVGTAPVTYQWRFNGANLVDGAGVSGAATPSLTLSNVQAAQTGNYSVVVSNAVATVTSSEAALSLRAPVALADALDAPALTWVTSGTGSPWVGRTAVTHDGVDAAVSGTAGDSQYTYLRTTVTGPGTVGFWWKVSSETNRDNFQFRTNTVNALVISGEVDWQWRTLAVPAGSQTLEWRYSKNSTGAAGQDRAWLDQVTFVPETSLKSIVARIGVSGNTVSLSWEINPGKTYHVLYKDGLAETEWKTFSGSVVVNGSVAAAEDTVDARRQRFYRILEQ